MSAEGAGSDLTGAAPAVSADDGEMPSGEVSKAALEKPAPMGPDPFDAGSTRQPSPAGQHPSAWGYPEGKYPLPVDPQEKPGVQKISFRFASLRRFKIVGHDVSRGADDEDELGGVLHGILKDCLYVGDYEALVDAIIKSDPECFHRWAHDHLEMLEDAEGAEGAMDDVQDAFDVEEEEV